MVKKTTNAKAQAGVKAPAEAKTKSPADVLVKELVAEASIEATLEPKETKKVKASEYASSYITVFNTTQNELLLNTGIEGQTVRIAPKEIKSIERSLYKELIKIQVIRNWFDKGILATSEDASETSAHEAKAPENLTGPVERTDSVSTVSASVTKFEKEGSVSISL